MVNTETTEEFVKELDLTEEEIESYTGCSERTQRCLTDGLYRYTSYNSILHP